MSSITIKPTHTEIKFDKPFIHINGKYYEFNGSEEGLKPLESLHFRLDWDTKVTTT